MSEKVTNLIEEIKGLTVLELSELVKALEENSVYPPPLLWLLLRLLQALEVQGNLLLQKRKLNLMLFLKMLAQKRLRLSKLYVK